MPGPYWRAASVRTSVLPPFGPTGTPPHGSEPVNTPAAARVRMAASMWPFSVREYSALASWASIVMSRDTRSVRPNSGSRTDSTRPPARRTMIRNSACRSRSSRRSILEECAHTSTLYAPAAMSPITSASSGSCSPLLALNACSRNVRTGSYSRAAMWPSTSATWLSVSCESVDTLKNRAQRSPIAVS